MGNALQNTGVITQRGDWVEIHAATKPAEATLWVEVSAKDWEEAQCGMMCTFPQRLRICRQVHFLRTKDLAASLGVTPQYITRLEMPGCKILPSIKVLLKMAALLHVTVGQLLGEVPISVDKMIEKILAHA